jgi:hypothetical protein
MSIMRSTDFKAVVEPILNEGFDGVYDQRKDEWKALFTEQAGLPRAYQEEYVQYGFAAAPELPDGTPVSYQAGGVLFVQRYVPKVYGLAYALTKVLVEDSDHVSQGKIYSKHLAQSLIETKETVTANVINRMINTSYKGGDGVPLISASHPIVGGTFSNRLTTDAALSQTAVEQLLIQIRNAVDNNGKRITITPDKLVIAPSNMFQAEVILKSTLRSGTVNNDLNAVKSMGLIADTKVISRLTSNIMWGITTSVNKDNGLKLIMRRKLERSMEGDFETDSMRYKATERYAVGWTDPRGFFATPGL